MIPSDGATGLVGNEISRLSRAEGKPVKAQVRSTYDQVKVDQLKRLGALIVRGNLRDRALLETACQEVDSIIIIITTASSMPFKYQPGKHTQNDGSGWHLNLISAAQDASVKRFVFIFFPPANLLRCSCPSGLQAQFAASDEMQKSFTGLHSHGQAMVSVGLQPGWDGLDLEMHTDLLGRGHSGW